MKRQSIWDDFFDTLASFSSSSSSHRRPRKINQDSLAVNEFRENRCKYEVSCVFFTVRITLFWCYCLIIIAKNVILSIYHIQSTLQNRNLRSLYNASLNFPPLLVEIKINNNWGIKTSNILDMFKLDEPIEQKLMYFCSVAGPANGVSIRKS